MHFLREVEHFFETYKHLEEGHHVEVQGWAPAASAIDEVQASMERSRAAHAAPAAAVKKGGAKKGAARKGKKR